MCHSHGKSCEGLRLNMSMSNPTRPCSGLKTIQIQGFQFAKHSGSEGSKNKKHHETVIISSSLSVAVEYSFGSIYAWNTLKYIKEASRPECSMNNYEHSICRIMWTHLLPICTCRVWMSPSPNSSTFNYSTAPCTGLPDQPWDHLRAERSEASTTQRRRNFLSTVTWRNP